MTSELDAKLRAVASNVMYTFKRYPSVRFDRLSASGVRRGLSKPIRATAAATVAHIIKSNFCLSILFENVDAHPWMLTTSNFNLRFQVSTARPLLVVPKEGGAKGGELQL
jgi:hypothetical protein